MNILFIGPYRQADGWGDAAIDYIRSLATQNINLAIRPIYLANHQKDVPIDILSYECNSLDKYDAVIQNTLPHFFVYNGKYGQNIGLSYFESDNLQFMSWNHRVKMMDKIMSPHFSFAEFDLCVSPKLYDIGAAADIDIYKKEYPKLPDELLFDENFVFYTEFSPNEPVKLLIKTSGNEATYNALVECINNVKKNSRLVVDPSLLKESILITNYIPDEELYGIHQSCDCFVMPSRGEAICRPLIDAMGFGNQAIVTDNTGMSELSDKLRLISSTREPCFVKHPPLMDLYTSYERWREPSISSLMKQMREAFEAGKQKVVYDMTAFSYESAGKRILEVINDS
jgi:hypothetical protein